MMLESAELVLQARSGGCRVLTKENIYIIVDPLWTTVLWHINNISGVFTFLLFIYLFVFLIFRVIKAHEFRTELRFGLLKVNLKFTHKHNEPRTNAI